MTNHPNRSKRTHQHDVLEVLKKLPVESFSVLPSEPRLIGIHRGVPGYTPLRLCESKEAAHEMAARLNKDHGVDDAQAEAMKIGSMFGWHVPGADPDLYR
jgi:hypothetical protein